MKATNEVVILRQMLGACDSKNADGRKSIITVLRRAKRRRRSARNPNSPSYGIYRSAINEPEPEKKSKAKKRKK